MNTEHRQIPLHLQLGGVARTSALVAAGFGSEEIRRAVRDGQLIQLRRGWLASPTADPKICLAVKGGGVLGCASAVAFWGGWDLDDSRIHVYRTRHGRAARGSGCPAPKLRAATESAVLPLIPALLQAVDCLPGDEFLMLAESVIHRDLATEEEVRSLLKHAGPRGRPLAAKLDRAESGTETLVRLRLCRLGINVQPQVNIPGVGRVDFLVGTSFVIEVDSKAHHEGDEAYERDRVRDQLLVSLGYRVIRITYKGVMVEWEEVEPRILQVVQLGLHLRKLPKTASIHSSERIILLAD